MLWIEKYAPQKFENLKFREVTIKVLQSYTINNVPNIIFCGQSGFGKKTIVRCFLNHLFQKEITLKPASTTIDSGSREITVNYLESEEFIEITPSNYGNQDKLVIQSLIKSLAQTKSVARLMAGKAKNALRFIILNQVDELSKDAQAALRRTMEKYSSNFRLILICEEINTLIEPIRSRCIFYRINSLSDNNIEFILNNILEKEDCRADSEKIKQILSTSNGNLRKSICILENVCNFTDQNNDKQVKKLKIKENIETFLEYEKIILDICHRTLKNNSSETVSSIRKDLYSLLASCIPAKIILRLINRNILSMVHELELKHNVAEIASLCEERLKKGTKDIIHLEYYIVAVMSIS